MEILKSNMIRYTDVQINLDIAVVSHYNDYLDRLNCRRGRGEVIYFYVGNVFYIYLGSKYANFPEKIFMEISGKNG